MSLTDVLNDVELVLKIGSAVGQAGGDAYTYITQAYAILKGEKKLSDSERNEMLNKESELRNELQEEVE